jgi:hypothetical protein
MRVAFVFAFAIGACRATCGVAQEPGAQIVRNPYYFEPALVGSRYQAEAAEVRTSPIRPVTAAESPAASSKAVESSRSAERMQAIATAFNRPAPHRHAVPGRFSPAADAKPLVASDRPSPVDLHAVPHSDGAEAKTSSLSLTSAVDNQLAVTRLAANPLRGVEATSVVPAAVPTSANPLR